MTVSRTADSKGRGFTLLEMMAVLAVFSVITAFAIPRFMSMLPGMRLNGAARQIMEDLMAARMEAVKRNDSVKVAFGRPGHNRYQIRVLCDTDDDGTVDRRMILVTRNIRDNYHDVNLRATRNPIFFPRGTAYGTTVRVSNSSGTKSVRLAITGRVKIQ